MKIEKMNLTGFGKFKNEEIVLSDGINILYGENEAGKTTIHNFIDGMFYGFLRPYVTRALYMEEHDRYNPWNGDKYYGSIEFVKDDRPYTIEREFTRGNESTSVFDRDTGKDITKEIDVGDGGRILQPGFHFFGFNDAVYSNTISIKQLGSETGEDLANEVRDKLANLSSSKDEDISIDNAVAGLDSKIRDIGSQRAPTSKYGKNMKELEKLNSLRRELLSKSEEYENFLLEDGNIDRELGELKKDIDKISEELDKSLKYEKKDLVDKVEKLKNELDEIIKEKSKLEEFKDLNEEDYFKLVELSKDINNYGDRIRDMKEEFETLEIDIKGYELESPEKIENIALDKYVAIEEGDILKEKLIRDKENTNIENLRIEHNELSERRDHNAKLMPMTVLLTVITVLSVFILDSYIGLLINIFTIPVMIYLKKFGDKAENKLEEISSEIEKIKENNRSIVEKIDEIEEREERIFDEFDVQTKAQLKRLADRIEMERINKQSQKSELEKKTKRLEYLKDNLKKLEENKIEYKGIKSKLLLDNKMDSLENFKIGLDKKKEYDKLILNKENKENLIKQVAGENDIASLKKELEKISFSDYKYEKSDLIKERLEIRNKEHSRLNIDKNVMEERLENLNNSVKKLLEVNEDIDRINREIKDMDMDKEAIELARDTIIDLSNDIHREFAPDINRRVGEIVKKITDRKYEDIKIDEDLNISVVSPIDGKLIGIESLSGGTIDQLYFALRFGIIDEVKDSSVPLILDDCFIQYDDERLENMLKFLVEEGKKRQIILFSCHSREKNILDRLGADYNLIEL